MWEFSYVIGALWSYHCVPQAVFLGGNIYIYTYLYFSFFQQLLPQRCTWLYVMNNVLMSVSGTADVCNRSLQLLVLSENTECCIFSAALRNFPSRREVFPALFPQSDSSVRTERTSAEETQQSVTQHQPVH